ncbi:hypothetical protein D3C81_1956710 [compost metagenome]
MSKAVIFGVTKETVGTAMDEIKKVNEDSMMVLAPFRRQHVHACPCQERQDQRLLPDQM